MRVCLTRQVTKTPDPSLAQLVERSRDYDLYNNSLRIENGFLTPNDPRLYMIFRDRFANGLKEISLPLPFSEVRLAENPLNSTARVTVSYFPYFHLLYCRGDG
jgi:hypothetical protein